MAAELPADVAFGLLYVYAMIVREMSLDGIIIHRIS